MRRLPLAAILQRVGTTLADRRVELDALDAALGDGDHGSNLVTACTALAARREELAGRPLAVALRRIAEIVAEAADGRGGRMYAAFFRGMADAAEVNELDWPRALAMLRAGRIALERESGLGRGAKTLLDVVAPVVEALERAPVEADTEALGSLAVAAAGHAMHHTRELVAAWEPASRLGSASLEHIDPGACSAALVVGAVVATLSDGEDGP